MHKDFRLDAEMEAWVKMRIATIMGDLQKMPDEGDRFKEIVISMIKRERHYVSRDSELCKSSSCADDRLNGRMMDVPKACSRCLPWTGPRQKQQRKPGEEDYSRLENGGVPWEHVV